MEIKPINVQILDTHLPKLACIYANEIQGYEEFSEYELEEHGTSEYYYYCLDCIEFYKQELEKIKPIIESCSYLEYKMLEEAGWKDVEHLF